MTDIEEPDYNALYELAEMPTPDASEDPFELVMAEISEASDEAYYKNEPLSPAAEEALLVTGFVTELTEIQASMRALKRRHDKHLETLDYIPATSELELELQAQAELRNKADILATLATFERLGLDADHYFVIGGANLVLRGIKPSTPDIDILVSDEMFVKLQDIDGSKIKQPPRSAIARGASNTTVWVKNDLVDVPLSATTSLGDGYYPISFKGQSPFGIDYVNDIPCLTLHEVIAAKAHLQRTKDLADLKLIEKFVGRKIDLPPIPADINPSLVS